MRIIVYAFLLCTRHVFRCRAKVGVFFTHSNDRPQTLSINSKLHMVCWHLTDAIYYNVLN